MKLEDLRPNSEAQQIAIENCIMFARVGSFLYGTNTKNSDEDYVGIFIEPEEYKLGRKKLDFVEFRTNSSSSGERNKAGDLDCNFYSLDKWIGLLANNNPNVLEHLFINKQNLLYDSYEFQKVVENRNLFISKKVKHSFSGYAYSQIQRNEVKSGNQTGRKELIGNYGFDPKLLSHALRLYVECLDLLVGGELTFPLYNNQTILDIKNGLWPYEKFQEECKKYENLIDKAYIESKLQYNPNHEAIHNLQVKLYRRSYK